MKNILVTGGSGQVGKELKKLMPNARYISSCEYNLTKESHVIDLFKTNSFDTVIHLAARVGGILDNIQNPAKFYDENIQMNTLIIKHAYLSGVKNLLATLSTCIYPDKIKSYPIVEEELHNGMPPLSNLAYAYAKRAMAIQIQSYNEQYKTNYKYVIPCNLYGITSHSDMTKLHFVNALLMKIIDAKKNNKSEIQLLGDGTPRRQFIHCKDLARVIYEVIEKDLPANFNIAGPYNHSIKEMAEIALQVTGNSDIKIIFDTSKPNGQLRKDADTTKLKSQLPDFTFTSFEEGIKELYDYYNK